MRTSSLARWLLGLVASLLLLCLAPSCTTTRRAPYYFRPGPAYHVHRALPAPRPAPGSL